ncbi:MAG: hypothetical protein QM645_13265 [Asticcacaulis sp.]
MKFWVVLAACGLGLTAYGAQAQAINPALCQWHTETHSFMHKPDAGYYKEDTLKVPDGYDGLRIEGQFRTLKRHEDWVPGFGLMFQVSPEVTYILRFKRPRHEETMLTETELWLKDELAGKEAFGHRQNMKTDFRADVLWNTYGEVTLKVYTSPKGFRGPYEVRRYNMGAASMVKVTTSTANLKIKSLRFGRVCTPV